MSDQIDAEVEVLDTWNRICSLIELSLSLGYRKGSVIFTGKCKNFALIRCNIWSCVELQMNIQTVEYYTSSSTVCGTRITCFPFYICNIIFTLFLLGRNKK